MTSTRLRTKVKEVYACAFEPPDTSKLHKEVKKYQNVDEINWTKDVPKKYERRKHFLPNRVIARMPLGTRKFHDWYLRAQLTHLNEIKVVFPEGTFGGAARTIMFDFEDMQECFHLGWMELNIVCVWCL
jgi:hypothetical protein